MLPLLGGIIFSVFLNVSYVPVVVPIIVFVCMIALVFLRPQKKIVRMLFLLCADIFLFCFAINLIYNADTRNRENYIGHQVNNDSLSTFVAEITDLPVQKDKTVKCQMKVLAVKEGGSFKPVQGKIIGYFKRSLESKALSAGQVMVCRSKLTEIEPPKNPFEFDYRAYMANKQIYHLCFIDSSSFLVTQNPSTSATIMLFGLRIKNHILSALKHSELSQEAQAICAALLTGYTVDIDKNVMDAFAHSGTLHVLSVSGLHTGLIFLFLSFLFDLFDRRKRHKISKFVFITISLWCFALVSGFSPPVLRAVIMFNLLGFGRIFFRSPAGNQINILFVSAFILLVCDPFLLFDIGFQLSYAAMLGIFVFQPFFENLYRPQNKVAAYVVESVGVSFAATLATLPLTLFYFKQFPFWFFICNLVVVPATFMLLLLAFLVILKLPLVAAITNAVTSLLIWFINLFNAEGVAYIGNIHFEKSDSFFLCFVIVLMSLAVHWRSFRYCVISLLVVIAWQLNNIFVSSLVKHDDLFTVYHVKKQCATSVKMNEDVVYAGRRDGDHNYHVRPHLISFNYPRLTNSQYNFIKSGKEEVMLLSKKNSWPAVARASVTTLVLSNNFKLNAGDIAEMTNLKRVICDGSNSRFIVQKTRDLCDQFHISFHNTQQTGAYLLPL